LITVETLTRHWISLHGLVVALGLLIYVGASHARHQRRHPSAAIAWVIGLVLLPYLTLPLYLLFGSRKLVRNRPPAPTTIVQPDGGDGAPPAALAQQLARALGLPPPAPYLALNLHADGHQALLALRGLIDGATRTLDVSTFIFGRDALGDEIGARLVQRAEAGVRVRLLLDGIGLYLGGWPNLRRLAAGGVEVARFVPPLHSPLRGRTNLRNHRKMAIADGDWLWCGGRNLTAQYFEGDPAARHPTAPWRDLTFDLHGGLAVQASERFEQDWRFATGTAHRAGAADAGGAGLVPPRVAPAPVAQVQPAPGPGQATVYGQLVPSGPDQVDDTVYSLLVSGCFTASQRLLAISPYFLPDSTLLMALMLAARRGVAVDLIVPRRSNHRLADIARNRALGDLIASGARVWMLPYMAHAKAVVIDQQFALVGSANLDDRSLFLNYELMVAFYDRDDVQRFAQWIDGLRRDAAPFVARAPGLARDVGEGLVRWLAFQL
jgi:cardiolipin synthase